MILYSDNTDANTIKKIDDSDLQFLASQLNKLMNFVSKNITLSDNEKITVAQLEEISKRMLYRQYDTLINDVSIINYDGDIDRYDDYHLDDADFPF